MLRFAKVAFRTGPAVVVSIDLLKSLPFLKDLNDSEIAAVVHQTRELTFQKGQMIFLEGDRCLGLYVVGSGRVRVFKASPEGREQILRIVQPGESFNDIPVFDGGPNPASAIAQEPAVVYLIPREPLTAVIAKCPGAMAVVSLFAGRIRHLNTMVENLAFRSVVSRLAKLLAENANPAKKGAPPPRLTQDDMAAMVGSVRDVVGRGLKYLEKVGAIKLDRHKVMVLSLQKLKDIK
jgi:CRP-like cAMP-binding protein